MPGTETRELSQAMLPKPDLPLLRKALDWAEAEAFKPADQRHWDQGHWRYVTDCGTSYCIAGYVAEMAGGQWMQRDWCSVSPLDTLCASCTAQASHLLADPDDNPSHVVLMPTKQGDVPVVEVGDRAKRLLGLTRLEADSLFEGSNGLGELRKAARRIAERAGERL